MVPPGCKEFFAFLPEMKKFYNVVRKGLSPSHTIFLGGNGMKVTVLGKQNLFPAYPGKRVRSSIVTLSMFRWRKTARKGKRFRPFWLDPASYPLANIRVGGTYQADYDSQGLPACLLAMLTMSAETVAFFYWQGLTIDRLTNMVYTGQRGSARRASRPTCLPRVCGTRCFSLD